MTTPHAARPFLGPRPFQAGEKLYGRDYEARALLSMLIAERIVLLHSPSGAGKTSLIQAALIPLLEEREFVVLPTVRVGQEPPAGWTGNRYVRAAMLSLEEGRPTDEQLSLSDLDSLTLAAYLSRRAPADGDTVLVIDQFEEILTRDPTDQAAKLAFFRDLGDALRANQLWALCVVREEYVAALEPYARLLPTRLSIHFRLDLLGVEGALSALREPPRSVGVDFPEAQATRLIDDLRRANVQQADGSIIQQLGPSVEPVQLQVVGLRLWERLPAGATVISAAEVDALGDVGTALGDYYAERIAATAQATGVGERALRRWFDHELITSQGVRGQVLQGTGESAGLPNEPILRMIDAYLVRAEPRRGATWFELAHDRLIAPVRASNAAWFAANLSTLQRQAEIWEQQNRPEGLLLRGAALTDAETWASANADVITASEREFLDLCRAAQRRAALLRRLSIGVAVAAVIALALAFVANSFRIQADANAQEANLQRSVAESNARQSRARALAANAVSSLPNDPQRSLILARAAYAVTADAGESAPPVVIEALEQAVTTSRVRQILVTGTRGIQNLAVSPDGARLASAGNDGVIRIFDTEGHAISQIATNSENIPVLGLAFSPDGKSLAAGTGDQAIIWSVADGTALLTLDAHPDQGSDTTANDIYAVAFSPDGKLIATASADGTTRTWDAVIGMRIHTLDNVGIGVGTVVFSPNGTTLATGDDAGQIALWDVASATKVWQITAHQGSVAGLAFRPDGKLLASGSSDLTARLWNPATGTQVGDVLRGHSVGVSSVTFSPNGKTLATSSEDGTARLWAVDDTRQIASLAGHEGVVSRAVFSPDGGTLFTAGMDGSIRRWDLSLAPADGAYGALFSPNANYMATYGVDGVRIWDATHGTLQRLIATAREVTALAYRADNSQIAAGMVDGTILLINPISGEIQATLTGHTGVISQLAYTPNGTTLASASYDTTVRLWDTTAGSERLSFPKEDSEVTAVDVSADGTLLASAAGGIITIRGVADGTIRQHLTLRAGVVVPGLAFSPDSKAVVAGDERGNMAVWDIASGAERIRTSVGSAIYDLAYSPDGTTLATAEGTRQVRLWDAVNLTPTRVLPHAMRVNTVAYRSDGTALISASSDGIARVFPLLTDDLLALAQQRSLRAPRPDECQAYGPLPECP